MVGPVVAGLLGTVAPAFGYMPALGGDGINLDAFVMLFDWPGNQGSSLRGYRRAHRVATESAAELAEALQIVVRGATAQPLSLQLSGAFDLSKMRADTQIKLDLGGAQGEGLLRPWRRPWQRRRLLRLRRPTTWACPKHWLPAPR